MATEYVIALRCMILSFLLLLENSHVFRCAFDSQYNPPSPASQFLMTPQAAADVSYGYTYGSPQRRPARKKQTGAASDARNDVSEGGKTTSANATPLRPAAKQNRESPSQPEGVVSE